MSAQCATHIRVEVSRLANAWFECANANRSAHAFRNESGAAASMLLLFAPGAPREDYFETLARVAEGRVLSHDEKAEFYIRHDTYWL